MEEEKQQQRNRRRPHSLERHPVAESAVEQDLTAVEYDYAGVAEKTQLLLMVLNFSKDVGKHVSHHYLTRSIANKVYADFTVNGPSPVGIQPQ
jgi:hypothetical protein